MTALAGLRRRTQTDWLQHRQDNQLPHPPLVDVKRSGIYLLVRFGQDHPVSKTAQRGVTDTAIMEWSPSSQKWAVPGLAHTNMAHLDMHGYRVAQEIVIKTPDYDELLRTNLHRQAY